MSDNRGLVLRAGLIRPGDTLIGDLGQEVGVVISTATPSPLRYDRLASITFVSGAGRQVMEVTAGTYIRARRLA